MLKVDMSQQSKQSDIMPCKMLILLQTLEFSLKLEKHITTTLSLVQNPVTFKNQGVCHTVALTFTLKSILRQKRNYGNSNISSCKNINFKTSSRRNQTPSRYYNSITNLRFQHKPTYHLSKILI
jgi:hypothetical protein